MPNKETERDVHPMFAPPRSTVVRDAFKDDMAVVAPGKSSCCGADIDLSHVITSGRHKGHGARYCSKCGRCLFMV